MSELDGLRVQLRRRAIAEGWTTTKALIAEDTAETAREDGTHALRSIAAQAERLGVATATVKRHRQELVRQGVFTTRSRGGNGRGATVVDLTPGNGSTSGVDVIPYPSGSPLGATVIPDSPSSGSVGDQSRITVEREREPSLLPSSPTSSNGLPEQLAAARSWPLDHCTKVLETKRTELTARGINRPDSILTKIIAADPNNELPAPVAVRRTMRQCADVDPHGRHNWEEARNSNHCLGVDQQNADGTWTQMSAAPDIAAEAAALPPPPSGDLFGNFAAARLANREPGQ